MPDYSLKTEITSEPVSHAKFLQYYHVSHPDIIAIVFGIIIIIISTFLTTQ